MKNRHDRLTKYGVVALAGVAVLGWIREPEKHQFSRDSASASSAQSRTTFPPPPDRGSVPYFNELPGGSPSVANEAPSRMNSVTPARPTTERKEQAALETDQKTTTRERAPTPTNDGRHEGSQPVEAGVVTRPEEPRQEHPLEPDVTDRAARNERPQDKGAVNPGGQTQPMVGKKERSTARSAVIIAGAAAAGAAIGAATGGGKGAAIGAMSGGAGGFLYDRMTRRKAVPAMPTITNSNSDTDQSADGPRYDRAPSLALRFGTPTFN